MTRGEDVNIDIVKQYFKGSGIPYEKGVNDGLFSPNFAEAKISIFPANDAYILSVDLGKRKRLRYYRTRNAVEAYKLIARYYFEDIIDAKFKKS